MISERNNKIKNINTIKKNIFLFVIKWEYKNIDGINREMSINSTNVETSINSDNTGFLSDLEISGSSNEESTQKYDIKDMNTQLDIFYKKFVSSNKKLIFST